MSYKIEINNKTFNAIDADNKKITISLSDNSDIIFFKKWQDKAKNNHKRNYIQDINFVKITEKGILKHCFPIVNENETEVDIYYDLKILKK